MKPLRFNYILKPTLWGGDGIARFKHLDNSQDIGECWEISGLSGNETKISGGDFDGKTISEAAAVCGEQLLGKKVFKKYGTNFPLLIKFIAPDRDLSIQVHPGDALAKSLGLPWGKTEMWYIVDTLPKSKLYLGFNHDITPEEYDESIEKGTLCEHLNIYTTTPGECYFIPSGQVHCIGRGNLLIEVQQSSNETYRIYDFGRLDANGNLRELHTELARKALNYEHRDLKVGYDAFPNEASELLQCKYFNTRVFHIDKPTNVDYSSVESFAIFVAFKGKAKLTDAFGNVETLAAGESIMFPAVNSEVKINPIESPFSFLEVTLPIADGEK